MEQQKTSAYQWITDAAAEISEAMSTTCAAHNEHPHRDRVAQIIEFHWENSLIGATEADTLHWLDEAQAEIQGLKKRIIPERRVAWLLRCEAAIKSMCSQFVCPKVTPEEMVDNALR